MSWCLNGYAVYGRWPVKCKRNDTIFRTVYSFWSNFMFNHSIDFTCYDLVATSQQQKAIIITRFMFYYSPNYDGYCFPVKTLEWHPIFLGNGNSIFRSNLLLFISFPHGMHCTVHSAHSQPKLWTRNRSNDVHKKWQFALQLRCVGYQIYTHIEFGSAIFLFRQWKEKYELRWTLPKATDAMQRWDQLIP